METSTSRRTAITITSSPTRLEGMETSVGRRTVRQNLQSPTRLEGMETKPGVKLRYGFLPVSDPP